MISLGKVLILSIMELLSELSQKVVGALFPLLPPKKKKKEKKEMEEGEWGGIFKFLDIISAAVAPSSSLFLIHACVPECLLFV